MANASKELPRSVQSDLHDMADKVGEAVAKNEMVEVTYAAQHGLENYSACTCTRYSALQDGMIHFWVEEDPECKYVHLGRMTTVSYQVPVID